MVHLFGVLCRSAGSVENSMCTGLEKNKRQNAVIVTGSGLRGQVNALISDLSDFMEAGRCLIWLRV